MIPEGVAMINGDSKLIYSNKTMPKIFKCAKSQIVTILMGLTTKPGEASTERDGCGGSTSMH